jgi:predicted PhzF superfamily epimerase YddE/YHI9
VEALERLRLDSAAFAPLDAEGFPPHVYAFARDAAGPTDLRARMQLYERDDPTRGVREDPATGSATACLGAYLLAHEGGEPRLRIAQGVEMGWAGPRCFASKRAGVRALRTSGWAAA